MGIKIKAILFPDILKNNERPVYIRLTQDRIRKYISTGITISEVNWNEKASRLWEKKPKITNELTEEEKENYKKATIHKNAIQLNKDIERAINDLSTKLTKLEVNEEKVSLEILKELYTGKNNLTNYQSNFLDYIKDVSTEEYNLRKIRTSEKYNVLHKKLTDYLKNKPLPIDKFTSTFLTQFQINLMDNGCHINYIHTNLKALKTIVRKAMLKDIVIVNPFDKYKMPTVKASNKEKLTIDEIVKIENLVLEEGSKLFHYKNLWLFSLYNAGIRVGDLLQLKWNNIIEGRLIYLTGKTNTRQTPELNEKPKQILKYYDLPNKKPTDYIFPFLENNAKYSKITDIDKAKPELLEELYNKIESEISKYNKGLKDIAIKASITKRLSSHIARHSFAELARSKGLSVYDICQMLGHSSIKITETYLESLDTNSMDSAMKKIFT